MVPYYILDGFSHGGVVMPEENGPETTVVVDVLVLVDVPDASPLGPVHVDGQA